MTLVNVVELKRPEYFNVSAALRNLADDIDAGTFGEVATCAVAMDGDLGLDIFGSGPKSEIENVYFTLGLAMTTITNGTFNE